MGGIKLEEAIETELHEGLEKHLCLHCGKMMSSKSSLNNHMKIHAGDENRKMYMCAKCGKSLSSKLSLNNHIRIHTGEKLFICHTCGKEFSDPSGLNGHKKIHDKNRKKFMCAKCEKYFTRNSFLKRHMKLHEDSQSVLPSQAKKETLQMNIQPIRNHSESFKSEVIAFAIETSISDAHKKYNISKKAVRMWMRVKLMPISCNQCGMLFAYENELERHTVRHLATKDEKKMAREDIEIQRKARKAFADHFTNPEDKPTEKNTSGEIHSIESEDSPISSNCVELNRIPEVFFREKNNSDQIRYSDPDATDSDDFFADDKNPNIPEVCDSVSIRMDKEDEIDLENLRKIEDTVDILDLSEEKEVISKYTPVENVERKDTVQTENCGFQLRTDEVHNISKSEIIATEIEFQQSTGEDLKEESKLKGKKIESETDTDYNSKKHICSVCGVTYRKLRDLNAHQTTHTGVKQYSCEICQRTFSFQNSITRHVKTVHGGEKHICVECGISFSQKSALDNHIQVVHKGNEHSCADCGKSFSQKSSVNHHIKLVHKGIRKHICSVCGVTYSKLRDLAAHVRRH